MASLVIRTKSPTIISAGGSRSSGGKESLVDSAWEHVDPNPDIHALFVQFDQEFFNGTLVGCEVRWSKRMTSCAGVCSYEGRGGLCSIRLSEPLLKFRRRKELVETLLHEMIHAYLFVTVRDRDRDGHGPQFQAHMNRINAATGANITIYHSFHDEVEYHQNHVWRCRGPCRDRAPYFGYLRRAMNRAPGPNDRWYDEHKRTCGGEFQKISEPERKKKAPKNEQEEEGGRKKRKNQQQQPIVEKTGDPRFPGTGHVLGGGSGVGGGGSGGGKITTMKRLEEYFPPIVERKNFTRKREEDKEEKPESSKFASACPICQKCMDPEMVDEHLDDCLTKSMLSDEQKN